MQPIIVCVKHAQGFRGFDTQYPSTTIPVLTRLGELQCSKLSEELRHLYAHVSLVVASSHAQAIQTALLAFRPALSNGLCEKFVTALPILQELSGCSSGSEVEALREVCRIRAWQVDLSLMEWHKADKGSATLDHRARSCSRTCEQATRIFLRERLADAVRCGDPESVIVIVGHSEFLDSLIRDQQGATNLHRPAWADSECRTFTFERGVLSVDPVARMIETDVSRSSRV
jgi:broad specificity phosphatase PhoE